MPAASIEELIRKIDCDARRLRITCYPKATNTEIAAFETFLGAAMPADMKTFYSFCNGFQAEEDLFRIIPLSEMIENKAYGETPDSIDFDFAEYLIYCDVWTMTLSKTDHRDYLIYNGTTDAMTLLTNSFTYFLDRFLNDGLYDALTDWTDFVQV